MNGSRFVKVGCDRVYLRDESLEGNRYVRKSRTSSVLFLSFFLSRVRIRVKKKKKKEKGKGEKSIRALFTSSYEIILSRSVRANHDSSTREQSLLLLVRSSVN